MKKGYGKYASCIMASMALTITYIATRDFPEEAAEIMRLLCDAFTIPGLVLLMSGALILLINAGALDSIGYVMGFVVRAFVPGDALRRQESYYDYIQRKRERPIRRFEFLFIVGGVDMAFSLLFLILFYVL